jgi:hypothetical protein
VQVEKKREYVENEVGKGGVLGLEQGIDGIDGKVTRNVKAHNTGKWVN